MKHNKSLRDNLKYDKTGRCPTELRKDISLNLTNRNKTDALSSVKDD